jgi:hypothetical protein
MPPGGYSRGLAEPEEGCARVTESRYIGCQRVDDPDHPTGPWRYYQSRFWARVELLPWDPRHEIDERRLGLKAEAGRGQG